MCWLFGTALGTYMAKYFGNNNNNNNNANMFNKDNTFTTIT